MSKVERKCEMCGKVFYTFPSQVKRGGGRYCSKGCGTRFRNLTDNPAKLPDVRKKIKENHADFSGKNNPMYGVRGKDAPNYKTGASKYNGYYRMVALTNKPPICEECGTKPTKYNLHVHHKDRDRSNNTLENLKVLCAKCHSSNHAESAERERDEMGRFKRRDDKNV